MIGQLHGKLLDKRAPWVMLDVAGVGYEVECAMSVFYQLPELGQTVTLHTHLAVREDAHLLFGFSSRFERELFRALIKVNGVGPKLALAILSGMEAEHLVACIRAQDSVALVKIPGVGKKTAERLVIEMSDRLDKLDGAPASLPGLPLASSAGESSASQDAIAALEALGYKPKDAAAAVTKVVASQSKEQSEGELTSEDLIRLALKGLAR